MNKDNALKLWVIKFCLKLIYPNYNYYAFLVFLAIKSRIWWKKKSMEPKIMDTFLFKTVPTYIVSKFVKDKLEDYTQVLRDKCIVISKEQYIQLCSENLFYIDHGVLWVSMKLSPNSKKEHGNQNIAKSKLSKYNLDFVTSELHKKLWTDSSNSIDNVRIVPVVGDKNVEENTAIVTENEFYNIASSFGTGHQDIQITFHSVPSLECSPKIAAVAEVNLVINHYDLSNDFLKEVLNNYFEVPKLLNVNDVICIELKPEITRKYHYKYLSLFETYGKLYFKCKNLGMETNNKKDEYTNIVQAYYIVKGVTKLTISENVHLLKAKDEFIHNKRDNLLELCPTGLKHMFVQIQEALSPFLNGEINDLSLSLSNPIIPMVLLTGQLGSGRHVIVKTLAKYNGMNCLPIDCNGLQSSTAKQTESKINMMVQLAKASAPVIVVLDNFEVFAVDPENNEDCRVVEHFITSLRELYENYTKHPIIFIAVTKVQDLKPNILRLFLDKFHIQKPNSQQRLEILEWFSQAMQLKINGEEIENNKVITDTKLSKNCEDILKKLAAKTETFLYGDLDTLLHFTLRESYLKQCNNQMLDNHVLNLVEEEDFNTALESIRSLQSQNLDAPKIPKVYWEDIGGLEKLKKEILKTIEFPIKYPHLFKNSSLKRSGILMYGPPGCGKTLVAKAVSTELNVSFLSVKGPELLNMYIGQSEENVRKVFEAARASSPCIVFLDELDALAARRGAAGDSGGASDRLVSQLLAELDGVTDTPDSASFVFIMGATNRPDLLEQSLLRPGRLDKLVYVGPYVGQAEKTSVLKALCRNSNLRPEVSLERVAAALPERCTGADLMQVVAAARAAAVRGVVTRLNSGLIKESELSPELIILGVSELWQGVESFRPSVTDEELAYYESMQLRI